MVRYQVKDWEKHFENDRSKTIDECRWVPIPNKNGMGKNYIMSLPDNHKIYSCWMHIVCALSRQRKPRRGWMTYDGTESGEPWTTATIAQICHCEVEFVSRLLEILVSGAVGWVCKYSNNNDLRSERELDGSKVTSNSRSTHVQLTERSRLNRIEENRREEKEENCASQSDARPKGNPNHAKLVKHFTDAWDSRYGSKYPFTSKDAKHAQWILKQVGNDLQQAIKCVDTYLANSDDFYVRDRHGLGTLVSQFRRFCVDAPEPEGVFKPVRPTEDEADELLR